MTAQIRLRLSSGLICKYGEIKVLFQMIYKRDIAILWRKRCLFRMHGQMMHIKKR